MRDMGQSAKNDIDHSIGKIFHVLNKTTVYTNFSAKMF